MDAAVPYLSQLLLGTAAFLALLKDWKDYGRLSKRFGRYVPIGLAALTLFITVLGLRDTYQTRASARADREKAGIDQSNSQHQITQLTDQVTQLRQDNQRATDTFSKSFANLYDRFSDLQSKVQNADLLKQIKETKQQLEETQKKLTQPKATLVATFPVTKDSEVPITEASLASVGDIVTVQFTVYNSSDVAALNGYVTARLCQDCKFAEEPVAFRKVAGAEDTDREFDFQHIFPRTAIELLSVKVKIPSSMPRFEFSLFTVCDACVVPTKQDLWINVK